MLFFPQQIHCGSHHSAGGGMSVVDFGPFNGESSKAHGGGQGCQCVSCANRPLDVSSWIVSYAVFIVFQLFHVVPEIK